MKPKINLVIKLIDEPKLKKKKFEKINFCFIIYICNFISFHFIKTNKEKQITYNLCIYNLL